MKNLINLFSFIVFIVIFVALLRFFEIDKCLDAGGMFDYEKGQCIGYRDEYSSLLYMNYLPFWIVISGLSTIPAILIRYIGTKCITKPWREIVDPAGATISQVKR